MKYFNKAREFNRIVNVISKGNLAFCGFIAAISASCLPTYHVLMFSSKCGEKVLAKIAYDHFSTAIGYSFCAFILSIGLFILKSPFERKGSICVLIFCSSPVCGAIYYNYKALISCATFIGSSSPNSIAQSHQCTPEQLNGDTH